MPSATSVPARYGLRMAGCVVAFVVTAGCRRDTPSAAAQPPTADYRISMEVRSKTWREKESPLDIGELLTNSLRASRIAVVPNSDPAAQAMLLIEFQEWSGLSYSSGGHGTLMSAHFTLLSTQGETLLKFEAGGSTPHEVFNEDLYEAAVRSFRSDLRIRKAGQVVRAGLGSTESLQRLLPDALTFELRPIITTLVERLQFDPASPTERAWLAVLRDDFATLRTIGPPAVDPLLAHLNASRNRSGANIDMAKSAAVLADIVDRRAATALIDAARTAAHQAHSPESVAAAISIFESASRLAGEQALETLDKISAAADEFAPPPPVREAAAEAARAIRRRNIGNSPKK